MPLDQLEVEVLSAGSNGLFGLLGAKKAVIRARPQGKTAAEEVAEVVAMVTEGAKPWARPKPKAEAKPRPQPEVETKPEPQPRPQPEPEPETAMELAPTPPEQPPARPQAPEDQPRPQPEDDEKARLEDDRQVREFALEVLTKLVGALDGDAQVKVLSSQNGVELDINGREVGILIGRRGQTLDALQYLTTRIVSHKWGRAVRLQVDASGYRLRRRRSLEETALRLAEKARESGRPVSIGPLNSQERRVVHLVLRSEKGVNTASRGRGELKKVLISPR